MLRVWVSEIRQKVPSVRGFYSTYLLNKPFRLPELGNYELYKCLALKHFTRFLKNGTII